MQKTHFSKNILAMAAVVSACLALPAVMRAQSIVRLNETTSATKSPDGAKAIAMLKRLQDQVIVYRSMGEFEESDRLARVPLARFESEFRGMSAELQPIVSQMPPGKFRDGIVNALASYRDGLFWWRRMDQPRVINVAALAYERKEMTPSDLAFTATIPYTVAVHWRQASKYLAQAENAIDQR